MNKRTIAGVMTIAMIGETAGLVHGESDEAVLPNEHVPHEDHSPTNTRARFEFVTSGVSSIAPFADFTFPAAKRAYVRTVDGHLFKLK